MVEKVGNKMKFLWFIVLNIHLYAHQNSLALLKMDVQERTIDGAYKLAVKDANVLVHLDRNFDGKIFWGEILESEKGLKDTIKSNISVQEDNNSCTFQAGQIQLDYLNTNKYIHIPFTVSCLKTIASLNITYSMLFDKDANHKAYLNVTHNGITHNTLFSVENISQKLLLEDTSKFDTFLAFIKEGVIHIFIGIDHILFLVALLLSSVLIFRNGGWYVNDSLKSVLVNVLKIVTAFTIAHSITLTLSILGLISLQSWVIESFIAFSVVLAAMNNLKVIVEKRIWVLVFIFGLIHGLGFASVLY